MLSFHIVTLFPEFFHSPLQTGLVQRGVASGKLGFTFHNPRDFSGNRHGHVDDAPYGGGPGMVMRAEPVAAAIRSIEKAGKIVLLSPAGRPLDASLARSLAAAEDVTLVCGRYEGIDSRLGEIVPELMEVSVGEAILNGGETAALAVMESAARFVPGFLGKEASTEEESLVSGLVEYPQYTRPEIVEGFGVPAVLLSGNHAGIGEWRRAAAVERTFRLDRELLNRAPLVKADVETLRHIDRSCAGRKLSFALCHYPVWLENRRMGCSSLTNLDVHDIARVGRSYGLGPFFVLLPLADQLALLERILNHWRAAPETDRAVSLAHVRGVPDFDVLDSLATDWYGTRPFYVAASARWPTRKNSLPPLTSRQIRDILQERPVVICLGTARGLALEKMPFIGGMVRPIRFLGDNHLSVRSAAAILADRILGDFY